MTQKELEHLISIKQQTADLIDNKFKLGAAEHAADGPLIDQSIENILDFAIAEAIDQITYLLTLKEKLNDPGRIR
jgi:hypothetical protein